MHLITHRSFSKLMDGDRQICRIHGNTNGLWTCVNGDDYANKIDLPKEQAENWFIAQSTAAVLSDALKHRAGA